MSIWLPSLDQVLLIHDCLIQSTGGSSGIRDLGLIDSALGRANASFGGVELYTDVFAKAAALCCGLAKNHGFIDGNKRIGVTTMLIMLKKNGIRLSYSQAELISLGLSVAQGIYDVPEVESWLRGHAA